jgi:chitinase
LLKRANDITPSHKSVSICKRKIVPLDAAFKYPPFPNDPNKLWEGIDGGIYDSISRYYGNGSSDCSNWHIGKLTTRDQLHVGNGLFRQAPYQSKIETAGCDHYLQDTR